VKKLLFAFKIELSRELKETKIKNGNVNWNGIPELRDGKV
jgi:hypothetical protein